MAQTYIGVDLSKQWLDIYHPHAGFDRVPNTPNAIADFLTTLGPQDILIFEATSLCDGPILRACAARTQPCVRLNPSHAWHFARSLNLPKTDRVDAKMLARLGAERTPAPTPPRAPERDELAELVNRRDHLKRMQTQEKNRKAKALSALVLADIAQSIKRLEASIKAVEQAIARLIADTPKLARADALLRSIPSVGPIASATLLAHLPELGRIDRRAIASLGGLAPRARESGTWRGKRYTGDGRKAVRRAMYMAGVSAMRCGYGAFVSRLRAKNKPGKVIVIAIARKLLTIANAVLRDQKPFKA